METLCSAACPHLAAVSHVHLPGQAARPIAILSIAANSGYMGASCSTAFSRLRGSRAISGQVPLRGEPCQRFQGTAQARDQDQCSRLPTRQNDRSGAPAPTRSTTSNRAQIEPYTRVKLAIQHGLRPTISRFGSLAPGRCGVRNRAASINISSRWVTVKVEENARPSRRSARIAGVRQDRRSGAEQLCGP